jgi:hypothetical protein
MARALPRRGALAWIAIVVVVAGVAGWLALQPRSPQQRLQAATDLVSGIRVTTTVAGSSLAATRATADFGVGVGVRLVNVRIVDELRLDLRIETAKDVTLASPPRLCLVGPYSAPDDAGLSDRCWGDPDLSAVLTARLATDTAARPVLRAGTPIDLAVTVHRGEIRCDYPPGTWRVELSVNPLVDGTASADLDAPVITFDLPFAGTQPLRLIATTRYCGLAESIVRDQGEPVIATP